MLKDISKINFFLGILLLSGVIYNIFLIDIFSLLWYCNIACFILGIGLITKNKILVSAIAITSIPAQFLWIIDLVLELFGNGLGRTYLIFQHDFNIQFISVAIHLILIPISIFYLFNFGFDKRSIYFILISSIFVFFITGVFSTPTNNINCIFYSCDSLIIQNSSFMHVFFMFLIWNSIFFVFYLIFMYLSKYVKID